MKNEIEILFFDIDKNSLREKLHTVGAKKVYDEFLQKRVVFDFGQKGDVFSWLRVRQEKDKTVMTYKETAKNDFAKELEVVVSDFEDTVSLLSLSGVTPSSYQENYREKYTYNNSEIVIDIWPWLQPVIEVESPSEEILQQIVKALELDQNNSFKGSINNVYKLKFGKSIQDLTKEQQMNFRFGEENQFLV
ncbi:MAG: CYTH domain-containing protein [Candidatus Pacebacteria bacterium]|nr:CYTH domain-containing protein [Candidatus Paceibacterota bacterium]